MPTDDLFNCDSRFRDVELSSAPKFMVETTGTSPLSSALAEHKGLKGSAEFFSLRTHLSLTQRSQSSPGYPRDFYRASQITTT